MRTSVAFKVFLELYKKRKCTIRELSEICQCSTRTIMRAIDDLTPFAPLYCLRGCKGGLVLPEEYKLEELL